MHRIKDTILSIRISNKTLQDLEFPTVLKQAQEYCLTSLGKDKIAESKPMIDEEILSKELSYVDEYLSSFENENRIPSHGFDDISSEVQKLKIENSFIESSSFLKIAQLSNTVNFQLRFFKKFKDVFPNLFELSYAIFYNPEIPNAIKSIIEPSGDIKNDASKALKQIRKDLTYVRGKINQSFNSALSKANASGFLDDIRETVIDNQRVLAVLAMYRRKVGGSVLGSSKSGNIVYIVPKESLKYSNEYSNLMYDEKQEIIAILRRLANDIRPNAPLIESYISYLTHIDFISAKASYARDINALLPKLSSKKEINFKKAFHPLLFRKNKELGLVTVDQDIHLNEKQQIVVISGPNAGGKSITLKTVGLLQIMFQAGFLIPVDEKSSTTIFTGILTDIGDNQSIENQLSTYSYRLKNMRNFLQKCNDKTLFLIDEFGTGSDPELGGALAEIFLEEFYSKGSYGIITTHYSNLKVLANELPNVTNANMQFNERTLEPMYKLFIGQAGSSFTFEVAQKNGIPFRLINQAKKRVESEKVRLDKTISRLQKERNKLQKNSNFLEKQKSESEKLKEQLLEKEQKVQEKLDSFVELYDNNQKMLSLGRKINELFNTYFQTNNKKKLITEFNAWVAAEKVKFAKRNPKPVKSKVAKQKVTEQKRKEEAKIKATEKSVLKDVTKIRKEKKQKENIIAKEKANYVFKINDRVRLIDSNSVGTIESIEKNKVVINFGLFTTKTTTSKLELVKKAK